MSLYKTGLSLCELPKKWHSSACILQISYFFASLAHLLPVKFLGSKMICVYEYMYVYICVHVHMCVFYVVLAPSLLAPLNSAQ